MKKVFDVTKLANELKGASVFFPREGRSEEPVPEQVVNSEEKETRKQGNKETSFQGNMFPKRQGNKLVKRYATYLTEESIKAIKHLAFDSEKKDYEIVQEAVEAYLRKKGY